MTFRLQNDKKLSCKHVLKHFRYKHISYRSSLQSHRQTLKLRLYFLDSDLSIIYTALKYNDK